MPTCGQPVVRTQYIVVDHGVFHNYVKWTNRNLLSPPLITCIKLPSSRIKTQPSLTFKTLVIILPPFSQMILFVFKLRVSHHFFHFTQLLNHCINPFPFSKILHSSCRLGLEQHTNHKKLLVPLVLSTQFSLHYRCPSISPYQFFLQHPSILIETFQQIVRMHIIIDYAFPHEKCKVNSHSPNTT